MQPSWRRLMNIGYARDGLIGTVQEQIKRAKREIGFTDLRFHGIFDDDMHIYQQNEDGSPWYNFTYADLLFDFILSVGLHPYVELGFVPSKMAKVQYRLFERCSIAGTYAEREPVGGAGAGDGGALDRTLWAGGGTAVAVYHPVL